MVVLGLEFNMKTKDLIEGDFVEFYKHNNTKLLRGIIMSIDYPIFNIRANGNIYKTPKEFVVNKLTPKQVEYNVEKVEG